MRRPAQFSHTPSPIGSTAVVPADFPSLAEDAAPPALPAIRSRPWQDDGRFAVVLVTLVALINIAVVIWLGDLHPKPAPAPHIVQDSKMDDSAPVAPGNPGVAIYSGEAASEAEPEVHVLDSKARPISQ